MPLPVVGDHRQAAVFLQLDHLAHAFVLRRAQLALGELAAGVLAEGFAQQLGPQQAADMVSTEREHRSILEADRGGEARMRGARMPGLSAGSAMRKRHVVLLLFIGATAAVWISFAPRYAAPLSAAPERTAQRAETQEARTAALPSSSDHISHSSHNVVRVTRGR